MNKETTVIMLEFNELSPILMDRFITQGHLPHFARMRRESEVYSTVAGENPPNLEPWIQWVTVHSGLSYPEHGIFHLGDGHKLQQKCLWDTLSDAHYRVAVCGSMNIRYDVPINGYVLPDPWTTGAVPYPMSLEPYFRFIKRNVQEYTNDRVPLSAADYWKFIRFMLTHGLSFSTVSAIVRQLTREWTGRNRWRRAQILDRLQLDLYLWMYRNVKPHFSTFFSNSTAHLQHMYWRNMEPEHFKIKPTPQEQTDVQRAIVSGYQEMDRMVGQFLELAEDGATLIFCTAFSQQPCLVYEESGGKSFYRPRDFEDLLAFAGIVAPHSVSPVMSEQFHVFFDEERSARDAETRLKSLTLNGLPALSVERARRKLFAGCSIYTALTLDSLLSFAPSGPSRRFFDIFYKVEGKKSGMHHPDGMLWIRRPDRKHIVHAGQVPLTDIAPMVLAMFDWPPGKPSSSQDRSLEAAAR